MRRAETARDLLLRLELIDRDDLARAADARALHDRQPDPAAAEHRDGLSCLQPRAAQRGTDPGQYTAADQCRLVERQFGVDLHDGILVQQHFLGIARNAAELAEGL